MMDKDTKGHNEAVSELILAGVPLGNIGDASTRLKAAISSADVVLAEDSRRFNRLCKDLESNVMPKFSHSLKEMKAHDLMKWRVI